MNYDSAMTKMEQYHSESSIGMRILAFISNSLTELKTCSVREKIVLVQETCMGLGGVPPAILLNQHDT